jgi:predicted acetyltransferase
MKVVPEFELIVAARKQKPILTDLLQLYIEEFSAFVSVPVGVDGRFIYKNLPSYWTEPGRHPFLIRVGKEWGGFVFVKHGSEISGPEISGPETSGSKSSTSEIAPDIAHHKDCWDMAEFFVLDKYRRRGLGSNVAHAVWQAFPGRWEVRVMEWHKAAHAFWAEAIAGFAGHKVASTPTETHGRKWRVFAFDSPAAQSGRPRKR